MNYLDEEPDYIFPFTAEGCFWCLVSSVFSIIVLCVLVWVITGGLK
jgi:hypothetical protein